MTRELRPATASAIHLALDFSPLQPLETLCPPPGLQQCRQAERWHPQSHPAKPEIARTKRHVRYGSQNGPVECAEIQNVRHRVGVKPPAAPNDPKTRQAEAHTAVEQGSMFAANIFGQVFCDPRRRRIEELPAFLDRQGISGGKAHGILVVSGQYLRVEIESVVEGEQPIGQYVAQ